jgi:hypothetical protein
MEQISALLGRYPTAATILWIVLVILGALLFWRGRRSNAGTHLSAESGGVVVGGDNRGSISTGSSSGASGSRPASKPHEIIGAIVALLGAVLAWLQWFYRASP